MIHCSALLTGFILFYSCFHVNCEKFVGCYFQCGADVLNDTNTGYFTVR